MELLKVNYITIESVQLNFLFKVQLTAYKHVFVHYMRILYTTYILQVKKLMNSYK